MAKKFVVVLSQSTSMKTGPLFSHEVSSVVGTYDSFFDAELAATENMNEHVDHLRIRLARCGSDLSSIEEVVYMPDPEKTGHLVCLVRSCIKGENQTDRWLVYPIEQ